MVYAVATKKITITLPEETLASLRSSAAKAGLPLSTYLAEVTAHHARIQDGLAEQRQWEAEHEPFTQDEIDEVDRRLARLDALARGDGDVAPPEARAS